MQNRMKILIVTGVGIAVVYFLLAGIEGRSLPLFLLLLPLFFVSAYLGFVSKSYNPLRFLSEAGAVSFFLLIVFVIGIARMDRLGSERIAQFIAPYPNINEISFLPNVADNQIQHWLVKTADPKEAVGRFYLKVENHRDWKLNSEPPILIFTKNDRRLIITIGASQSGSTIYYELIKITGKI